MGIFTSVNADGVIPATNLVLKPLTTGWVVDTYVSWQAKINYTDAVHHRNDTSPGFSGQSPTWTPIVIDFQNICLGGTITMEVSAVVRDIVSGVKDNARWTGSATINGQNPTLAAVKQRLGTVLLQAIAYKESKFKQFGADGLPLFGAPNGFGIMQLDNSPIPTGTQIWNWKENVDTGVKKFQDGVQTIKNHYNNLRAAHSALPQLTAAQIQLAALAYYNAGQKGFYFIPNAAFNAWSENPDTTYTDYADFITNIINLVNAGTPPAGWNG